MFAQEMFGQQIGIGRDPLEDRTGVALSAGQVTLKVGRPDVQHAMLLKNSVNVGWHYSNLCSGSQSGKQATYCDITWSTSSGLDKSDTSPALRGGFGPFAKDLNDTDRSDGTKASARLRHSSRQRPHSGT